ncbi:shikimate kinase [Candidatus Vallotia tarda]|uniref:Shikimate kinase n=1 Tax=Candidatus Vallotiella hemipterorum TaxID=1177213 RepID=A0A916NGI3_9BURK|nr:shikimate kinase [Candidatus Vallotia tarda]CAG7603406.1 Shikimate kinase [Candidatus Vallotia tarda]
MNKIIRITENASVFLIGLMGAGKTTIGRTIAYRLRRRFVDLDYEIKARTGACIPVIFAHEKEDGFRHRESTILNELTRCKEIVLATGGGTVMRPQNRKWLHARGIVIYLRVAPYDLWLRTYRDKNRPLLQTDNPRAELELLFELRDPLYRECAHVVIETTQYTVSSLVNIVLMKLKLIGIRPLLNSDV